MQFGVNKKEEVNFSKTTKLCEPIRQVQFVVWEKIQVLIYTKLHEKSTCYFFIIYMKNTSQKIKTDKILATHPTCNLHLCYMENAPIFSQSDAQIFFMYIIKGQTALHFLCSCSLLGFNMKSSTEYFVHLHTWCNGKIFKWRWSTINNIQQLTEGNQTQYLS